MIKKNTKSIISPHERILSPHKKSQKGNINSTSIESDLQILFKKNEIKCSYGMFLRAGTIDIYYLLTGCMQHINNTH